MEPKDEATPISPTREEPDFSKYSKRYRTLGPGTYWSEYEQARFDYALSSVAPEILKAIAEGRGQLFARWSPDIELDKTPGKVSRTVNISGTGMEETGISVYVVDPKKPNFGLDLRYSMAGMAGAGYEKRMLHIITGEPVDIGHDSEWLLKSTSIQEVLTVPYESRILEDFPELKYHNPYR